MEKFTVHDKLIVAEKEGVVVKRMLDDSALDKAVHFRGQSLSH